MIGEAISKTTKSIKSVIQSSCQTGKDDYITVCYKLVYILLILWNVCHTNILI